MCGIFGYIKTKKTDINDRDLLKNLFILSESRGKESSGLAYRNAAKIGVFKLPQRGSALIKNSIYQKIIANSLKPPFTIIGHARLVTNGLMEDNLNNQPVIKGGIVGVHNGIIVNDSLIWKKFSQLTKHSAVDTESLIALIRHFESLGQPIIHAIKNSFQEIKGTASIALLFNDYPKLLLATNNGSLYFIEKDGVLVFASEEFILKSLIKKNKLKIDQSEIKRVEPNHGYLFDIANLNQINFSLKNLEDNLSEYKHQKSKTILEIENLSVLEEKSDNFPPSLVTNIHLPQNFPKLNSSQIESVSRCTKCVLPRTMPFINFDQDGICNYCKNYKKIKLKNRIDLKNLILQSQNNNSKFDCIVPLSGGRDSSYALHYTSKILGLNPIAYSYDWGMLTDLGRRNQARMCGKLGIEHILISADIKQKRLNIKKNVIAWLKRPDLGTVPLFMAGDKQYFYFANKLSKQIGGTPIIYAENPYEKTDFKSGFCGIPPVFEIEHVYNLGLAKKIKLAGYYLKEYLKNPALFNSSVIDTLGAYVSSYLIPHNYIPLYLYKKWSEEEINSTLTDQYDWELASDTKTSWRIGDGTAAFYNFIYYTVAGFTETDTFRSNQIREGELDRENALKLIREENVPRYESIKWYCDIIGIDFISTIKRILEIPRLYR